MPERMTNPAFARRTRHCLAQIGPTRFDVVGARFFNDDAGADGGNTPPTQENNNGGNEDLGFPLHTPTDQMTDAQKAAYWRHESKKHQKDAERWSKLGDFETVKKALDDAEKARQASLSEQEKAVENARKEGETTGFERARDQFAKPALTAILVARTKGSQEKEEDARARVKNAVEALNVTAFLDENGELDAEKVETFAQSLAPSGGNGSAGGGDPLAAALRRQGSAPQGHAGSVAAMEKDFYDRLKSK